MKGIKLYPTESQRKFIDDCIEGYKIVYNWALSCEQNQNDSYKSGLANYSFLNFYTLEYMYKHFRDYDPIYSPLLRTLPTHTMLNAAKDVIMGYELFFKKKSPKPPIYYKTNKIEAFSSFRTRADSTFYFNDNYVKIEGLLAKKDFIETSYHTHTTKEDRIKYIDPIIFRNNYTGEYFLQYSVLKQKIGDTLVDIPISDPIGVDVNRQKLYACSNGIIVPYIDTSREEKHIFELDAQAVRDIDNYKGQPLSNSAKYRLEKRRQLYEHVSNIHRNNCYNGALQIIRCNPEAIILESLNLNYIMSDHFVAKNLRFHPLGVSQKILAQQAFKYDIPVYFAPNGFQSSNICSNCGAYKDIDRSKNFRCDVCGLTIDRDINAAINLKNWYIQNKDTL